MRDFIDISRSPTDQENPYLLFIFQGGVLMNVNRYDNIESLAAHCKRLALPVVSVDPHIRAELRAYSIDAQPPVMRAVGA
jgi:hypothetical protein